MSLKKKLSRMKNHMKHEIQTREEKEELQIDGSYMNQSIPYLEKWKENETIPFYYDNAYCFVREKKYPIETIHGHYSFSDFHKAVQMWQKTTVDHPLSAKGHEAQELFFFDTETTGLGGGVGNTIFILGHVRVLEKEVVLKQHILTQPGHEVPLYHSFLQEVDYTTLVTYNGKAFDWPQVKTRHTLIREHVPKLPSFGHFDLYHAARRMWKHRLESVKLSKVEEEILGIHRQDDIPGFLAPMIFFDFVERKDPEGMIGILKHNEIDLLSLITLYTHITFQLLQEDHEQTERERLEVGRWFVSLGEHKTAEGILQNVVDSKQDEAIHAKHLLAFEYKRQKQWQEAKSLWILVSEKSMNEKITVEAIIELAKIFEHKDKDYKQALTYCEKAMEIINRREEPSRLLNDFVNRITRLTRKIAHSFPG